MDKNTALKSVWSETVDAVGLMTKLSTELQESCKAKDGDKSGMILKELVPLMLESYARLCTIGALEVIDESEKP